jgi:hypothetical protein
MLDVAVKQELLDLNERFKDFLAKTKSGAFSRKRQFDLFLRNMNHSGKDMLGRPLILNDVGKISIKLLN